MHTLKKIDNENVLTIDEAQNALQRIAKSGKRSITITFGIERMLYLPLKKKILAEQNMYTPYHQTEDEHIHSLSIRDLQSIASINYPDQDFSENSISTEEIQVAIHAISSTTITDGE